jgi:hypothetical protein
MLSDGTPGGVMLLSLATPKFCSIAPHYTAWRSHLAGATSSLTNTDAIVWNTPSRRTSA